MHVNLLKQEREIMFKLSGEKFHHLRSKRRLEMITIVRGSGKNRKSVELAGRHVSKFKQERERIVEDLKALVLRPNTFRNFSGGL